MYNFKKYSQPKKGIFCVLKTDGNYLHNGWEKEIKEYTIIGEDNTGYVYKLKESMQGKWIGNQVITKKYILPISLHKSSFIKWSTNQLTLF